ncbi:hypothetical protein Dimus_014309 [Dionaea muscipula]
MAPSSLPTLLLILCILFFTHICSQHAAEAQLDDDPTSLELISEDMEWPSSSSSSSSSSAMMSLYGPDFEEDPDSDDNLESGRSRSLLWRSVHYYISYAVLSANRIPCPPRSGRSYYTHNCYRARGTVRPYSRGCSAITRCRR